MERSYSGQTVSCDLDTGQDASATRRDAWWWCEMIAARIVIHPFRAGVFLWVRFPRVLPWAGAGRPCGPQCCVSTVLVTVRLRSPIVEFETRNPRKMWCVPGDQHKIVKDRRSRNHQVRVLCRVASVTCSGPKIGRSIENVLADRQHSRTLAKNVKPCELRRSSQFL